MELKELLSSMSMEELMSVRQVVNTEIKCRREGERSRLEDELKKLVEEIRRSGFHVGIDVGDNYYQDDEWVEISVEY
jgi:hypothetical protein